MKKTNGYVIDHVKRGAYLIICVTSAVKKPNNAYQKSESKVKT